MNQIQVPPKYVVMHVDGDSAVEIFVAVYNDNKHLVGWNSYSYAADCIKNLFSSEMSPAELEQTIYEARKIVYEKYYRLKDEGYTPEQTVKVLHEDKYGYLEAAKILIYVYKITSLDFQEAVMNANITRW